MQQNTLTRVGVWGVRLLAALAIALSGYLLYAGLTTEPVAGCGWSSFDCDSALASRWSKWFGAPVAGGGLLIYSAALIGSILIPARAPGVAAAGWRLLEVAVPLAAGAALWFVGVQLVALGSFCLYCLLAHACGLAIAALVVALRLSADREEGPAPAIGAVAMPGVAPQAAPGANGPPDLGVPTVLGVLALAVLIVGQVFGPDEEPVQTSIEANDLLNVLSFDDGPEVVPRDTVSLESDPTVEETSDAAAEMGSSEQTHPKRREGGQRVVKLLQGNLTIDTYRHPLIGSPDAEHVLVELMDYACPHCRQFHELLDEALDRFEGRVAVVVMPVPGEVLCNPYVKKSRPKARGACNIAKVSLASAILRPEAFPDVHHWLLQGDRLPVYTSALLEAQRHANREKLSRTIRDDTGEIKARIERYVGLMASLRQYGKVGLPTQIFPNRVISGPPSSLDELCDLWAAEFGLEKPTDDTPLPF